MFFGCCVFCLVLFLLLAQRWRDVSIMWAKHEEVFLHTPYRTNGLTLATKIRVVAMAVGFLALGYSLIVLGCPTHLGIFMRIKFLTHCLITYFSFPNPVEHGLFYCSAIFSYSQKKKACDFEITDDWLYYFSNEYKYVFHVIPYSIPMAALVVVNICIYEYNYLNILVE